MIKNVCGKSNFSSADATGRRAICRNSQTLLLTYGSHGVFTCEFLLKSIQDRA
jgi:hypothetical protein